MHKKIALRQFVRRKWKVCEAKIVGSEIEPRIVPNLKPLQVNSSQKGKKKLKFAQI